MSPTNATNHTPSIPHQIANGFYYVFHAFAFFPAIIIRLTWRHRAVSLMLLILGPIVGYIVTPKFSNHPKGAKFSAAHADFSNFQTALDTFLIDNTRYPTPAEGLQALVTNPGLPTWKGPYMKKSPNDPWGSPYNYAPPSSPGKDCTLSSDGPDQRPNTPDDITPSTPIPPEPFW
jgi:general secretion pathway protein G